MSEQKWTAEPWDICDDGDVIFKDGGGSIAIASERDSRTANASRIVACVNGSKGMNPEAFADCVNALDLVKAYSDKEAGKGHYNGELPCHIASAVDDAIANARTVSA